MKINYDINNQVVFKFDNDINLSCVFGFGTYTDKNIRSTNFFTSNLEIMIYKENEIITKKIFKKYFNKTISDHVEGYFPVSKLDELIKVLKNEKGVKNE